MLNINKFHITLLVGFGLTFFTISAGATWCTATHLVFNQENVKDDNLGQPFRIGKLDENGYSMAVIKKDDKKTYRYLRNIIIDKVDFREFRYSSFIFQLSLPNKDGVTIFREVFVDDKGVERGFAGVCS